MHDNNQQSGTRLLCMRDWTSKQLGSANAEGKSPAHTVHGEVTQVNDCVREKILKNIVCHNHVLVLTDCKAA